MDHFIWLLFRSHRNDDNVNPSLFGSSMQGNYHPNMGSYSNSNWGQSSFLPRNAQSSTKKSRSQSRHQLSH